MRFKVITLFALLAIVLPSCASNVPQELAVANRYEAQAIENLKANRLIIVDAYTKELRAAYSKQMDLIQKNALDNAQVQDEETGQMVVPRAIADQVIQLREAKEDEIDTVLAAKRAEFLADPNFDVATELNAKVGEWMKVYVEEFAGRVQELARIGADLYEGASGKPAPGFFEQIGGSRGGGQ